MKTFIVIFAVLIFAVLMGFLTFALMGPEGTNIGSTDDLLNVDRMGDAEEMMVRLVTAIVVASFVGALLIIFVLPKIGQAVANIAYDQHSQRFEHQTRLDSARSLKLQGEFELAIEEYRASLEEEGPDRAAWMDIAQIEEDEFEDLDAAMETLKEGWESHEWEMDDDVNFMTRMAKLYSERLNNRDEAVTLYKEIINRYEENEYHTNTARNELMELGVVV